jgi:hypothetical protein
MKLFIVAVGMIGLTACTTTAKPQQASMAGMDTGMRCVKLMNLFPEFDNEGKITQYDTSYAYVYAYGNQVMYHVSYTNFTHYQSSKKDQDSTVKQRLYYRLVFTRGQPYGGYYKDQQLIYNKKVLADSLLKEDWVGGNKVVMDTAKNNISLQSSAYLPNSDTLLEVYGYKMRADGNIYGTLHFYYVPLRAGLPYSIDTTLEKAKNMTLCKVVYFTHVGYNVKGKFRVLEYLSQTEMQEIPVINAAELLPYFERNKKGEYSNQIQDVGF